jgi:hypothetical protein
MVWAFLRLVAFYLDQNKMQYCKYITCIGVIALVVLLIVVLTKVDKKEKFRMHRGGRGRRRPGRGGRGPYGGRLRWPWRYWTGYPRYPVYDDIYVVNNNPNCFNKCMNVKDDDEPSCADVCTKDSNDDECTTCKGKCLGICN